MARRGGGGADGAHEGGGGVEAFAFITLALRNLPLDFELRIGLGRGSFSSRFSAVSVCSWGSASLATVSVRVFPGLLLKVDFNKLQALKSMLCSSPVAFEGDGRDGKLGMADSECKVADSEWKSAESAEFCMLDPLQLDGAVLEGGERDRL